MARKPPTATVKRAIQSQTRLKRARNEGSRTRLKRARNEGNLRAVWNAVFSEGIGLNLSPRIPKAAWVNNSSGRWANTARKWAGGNPDKWRDVRLGKLLGSDRFATWLRSDRWRSDYRPGFDRYERALRMDFAKAIGISEYAVVFRGMPKPRRSGLVEKSPISATKRVGIAADYASKMPGNRTGDVVVALLLPPGTKILPIGGGGAEYLLPPGTITPSQSHGRQMMTRMETNSGDSNLFYARSIESHINHAVRCKGGVCPPGVWHMSTAVAGPPGGWHREKPNVDKIRIAVVPAVFTPDPEWNGTTGHYRIPLL